MKRRWNYSRHQIRKAVRTLVTLAFDFTTQTEGSLLQFDTFRIDTGYILSRVLRFLTKRDHLRLLTAGKGELDDGISATFPLHNRIKIVKKEYHRMITHDPLWLPVVITHELGHWCLHAPGYQRFGRQLDLFEEYKFVSSFSNIMNPDHPEMDPLDRQANLFAREMLLPETNVKAALQRKGYYPPVVYREHHLTLMPFEEYCARLAGKIHLLLQAPMAWVDFRLRELELLQNHAASSRVRDAG